MRGKRRDKKARRRSVHLYSGDIFNPPFDSKLWFTTLNSLISRMIDIQEDLDVLDNGDSTSGVPIYFGYSISLGKTGVPLVSEFGNTDLVYKNYSKEQSAGKQHPAPTVETISDRKRGILRVIVEMPGLRKEDIDVQVRDRSLTIRAKDDPHDYNLSVPLKQAFCSIERTSYNNGVLEVVLEVPT